jgi:hypothetical protein
MKKVAILVVSHNNPTLTDSLCDAIIQRTRGVEYDLHVIETGSNLEKVSKHMTLWVKEGVRMTRGFNLLKSYADFTAAQNGYSYEAYHLFVNDAKFIDDKDITSILFKQMMDISNCGQINPYQVNIFAPHQVQNKNAQTGARKESFSEIICPMIRAKTWNDIPDLLDNVFFYGWGLDYDIPHKLHTNGWRLYISDEVGIFHQAFTSYRESHITEEKMDAGQFCGEARNNMNSGFIKKYGTDWKRVIYNSIPVDVSKEALYNWLHYNDSFNI